MVKFYPNDDVLFSCGFDEKIKIWEEDYSKDDFVLINTIKEHSGTVWCIEFNKKGDIFFTCSDDKSIVMWRIGNKVAIENNENNKEKITDYENILFYFFIIIFISLFLPLILLILSLKVLKLLFFSFIESKLNIFCLNEFFLLIKYFFLKL